MYRVDGVSGLKLFTGINQNPLSENNFVALFQGHEGFLPIGSLPCLAGALASKFAPHIHRVDLYDLHLEQLLDCLAYLGLVRAAVSHNGVLVQLFTLTRSLFGQSGSLDNIKRIHGALIL